VTRFPRSYREPESGERRLRRRLGRAGASPSARTAPQAPRYGRQATDRNDAAGGGDTLELAQRRDVDQRRRRLDAALQLDQDVRAACNDTALAPCAASAASASGTLVGRTTLLHIKRVVRRRPGTVFATVGLLGGRVADMWRRTRPISRAGRLGPRKAAYVMSITTLDHVNILSGDILRTTAFLTGVLGLQDGPRPPFGTPGAWLYANGSRGRARQLAEEQGTHARRRRIDGRCSGRGGRRQPSITSPFCCIGYRETVAKLRALGIASHEATCRGRRSIRSSSTDPTSRSS